MKTDTITTCEVFGWSFPLKYKDEDYAYAFVDVDVANARHTFTHELAHNFGCKHDNNTMEHPTWENMVYESQGYRFFSGWGWPIIKKKTMMAQVKAIHPYRLKYFSNPDVNFKGQPTGEVGEAENDNQIRNNACRISEYETIPPAEQIPQMTISGPDTALPGDLIEFCATVSNCPDIQDLTWEYSSNRIDYEEIQIGGNCLQITMTNNAFLYIRVTVNCGGDTELVDFNIVTNTDMNFTGGCDSNANNAFSASQDILKVFPTTTTKILNIHITSKDPTGYTIHIIDYFGTIHKSLKSPQNQLTVNVENLPNGSYLAKIEGQKNFVKFIKL